MNIKRKKLSTQIENIKANIFFTQQKRDKRKNTKK